MPLVTPGSAATGMPHVGHVPCSLFGSCFTGLGLKHMVPTSSFWVRLSPESTSLELYVGRPLAISARCEKYLDKGISRRRTATYHLDPIRLDWRHRRIRAERSTRATPGCLPRSPCSRVEIIDRTKSIIGEWLWLFPRCNFINVAALHDEQTGDKLSVF